jgi:diaminohydroxyphosphoribosylaminopyrimidine deaminase/5-amino-6-(5-phosphoribosylamino)uracil reductase
MTLAEHYMRRALELAEIGRGNVAPNPLVGCVIVHQDKLIGEGWHQRYGEAHAEVNAVKAVSDKAKIAESTVYVNLEPCAHFGKTPPCVDLLLRYHPQKVVIANLDPNPLVAGQGAEKLHQAGIEIETGVLAKEGAELNRRFFTFYNQKRPYIILKWAETADGFIARKNYDSKWISNSFARKLVHKWRAEESAIMVGSNTALFDNPQLTVRDWVGKNPVRVVIDKHLKVPPDSNLCNTDAPTIFYNLLKDEEKEQLSWVKLQKENFTEALFADLLTRKIQSVIVEGGQFLLNLLLEKGLWDEIRIFKSQATFEEGIPAPHPQGRLVLTEKVLDNWYFEYRR